MYHTQESDSHVVKTVVGQDRWKTNSYLVSSKHSGRTFLIDAGGEPSQFVSFLGLKRVRIGFVLLTHGHFDHLSSAASICSESDVACVVHSADFRLARQAPFYAIRFEGSTVAIPKQLIALGTPTAPDYNEWGIRIISVPGHTSGSCCFIVGRFVFTGDTLIREAVGRTDQPGGNPDELFASIEHILAEAPDDGVILAGHGRPWTIDKARNWWRSREGVPPRHDTFL